MDDLSARSALIDTAMFEQIEKIVNSVKQTASENVDLLSLVHLGASKSELSPERPKLSKGRSFVRVRLANGTMFVQAWPRSGLISMWELRRYDLLFEMILEAVAWATQSVSSTKLFPPVEFVLTASDHFFAQEAARQYDRVAPCVQTGSCIVFMQTVPKFRQPGVNVLIPGYEFASSQDHNQGRWGTNGSVNRKELPWSRKLRQAVWRGSARGYFFSPNEWNLSSVDESVRNNVHLLHSLGIRGGRKSVGTVTEQLPILGDQRAKLVKLAMSEHQSVLDCAFTSKLPNWARSLFRQADKPLPRSDYSNYRVILDVDGGGWSGRLPGLLLTNSAIVKLDSNHRTFYQQRLTEAGGIIWANLSSVVDQVRRVVQSDDPPNCIAKAHQFIDDHLSVLMIRAYWAELLLRYSALVPVSMSSSQASLIAAGFEKFIPCIQLKTKSQCEKRQGLVVNLGRACEWSQNRCIFSYHYSARFRPKH